MSASDILNIGEKLRVARTNQGLSLRELAGRADVSPSLLSQIENGRANPSVMTLYNVAEALSVPITFFFPTSESDPAAVVAGSHILHMDKTPSELRNGDSNHFDGLEMPESDLPIVRHNARVAIELQGQVRWERLTGSDENALQFLEIHYRPGASSGDAMSWHNGREFGYILSGVLTLELAFERHTLEPGDSIIFDSITPHRLSNQGDEVMRAVWILMNREA